MYLRPLPKHEKITQISFRNLKLELKDGKRSWQEYQEESVHYHVMHRGKVLMSDVEGYISSGQVHHIL